MPVDFAYEHVFRVASVATLVEAYFDPDHLAAQDKLAELGGRVVTGGEDTAAVLSRSWRVTSLKALPLFVRPFVSGGRVAFIEAMTWRRADDAVDVLITPDILGGRVQIAARYQLRAAGDGEVQRRYSGTISVNLKLVSGKIEKAIAAEFDKSMPMMTRCTQDWLDGAARRTA
jgi:hypothetical protein